MKTTIRTRYSGSDCYIARAHGKQASSTNSERCAVEALCKKLFPSIDPARLSIHCEEQAGIRDAGNAKAYPHAAIRGLQPGRWTVEQQ